MSENNINVNTPEIGPYKTLQPFRFWCQKVLPLVYDESLSYYELLCKVVDYLNKTMEDVDQMITDMGDFHDAYNEFATNVRDTYIAFSREVSQTVEGLETFVNNYFNNLDVQQEINNKLDAMAAAGYFDTLFTTLFTSDIITKAGNVTSAWIAENLLQETGYVIDTSLTVANAAADAKATGDAIKEINDVLEVITEIPHLEVNDNDLTIDGYINTNGSLDPNANFHRSAAIAIDSYMKNVIISKSGSLGGGCAVAFYSSSSLNTVTFISGVSLPDAVTPASPVIVEIPETALYVAFSARKANEFVATIVGDVQLALDDTFTSEILPASAKAVGARLNELSNWWHWQCDVGKPVIHFSFDDTCHAFIDIINGNYASIWEQSFFADLKNIHDTTGAVFTLNCFNSLTDEPTYSISDLPGTYAVELSAAKNWLKFAFHGEDDTSNYNTSTGILTAYNTFVSAIYTFTGDYECIDTITRLGYFGGSLENVLAIKEADHGITGLLSADDTRLSYYLDSDTNAYLYAKGKYLDPNTELLFIKSQPRSDSNTAEVTENNLLANPTNIKLTEIYMHEQNWSAAYKVRITQIATWANNNGYVHAFPSLIYTRP